MVAISGISFMMGSPRNELERSNAEGPQHEVTISDFLMGRYPITQAQWRFVASLPQVNRELKSDPSNFKGDILRLRESPGRMRWSLAVAYPNTRIAPTVCPQKRSGNT